MNRQYVEADFNSVLPESRLATNLPNGEFYVGEEVVVRDSDERMLALASVDELRPESSVMILKVDWDKVVHEATKWPESEADHPTTDWSLVGVPVFLSYTETRKLKRPILDAAIALFSKGPVIDNEAATVIVRSLRDSDPVPMGTGNNLITT